MAVTSVNVDIPYLKEGIPVRDWRKEYTAATALLDEKQKIALLPIYVNRNFGDQSWAYQTTEFESLHEALDFLERHIDGSKSSLVKVTDFFNIQLDVNPQALTRSDLSLYWFKVQESGRGAGAPLLWPLIHCCSNSFCNSEEFSASYPIWIKKKFGKSKFF